MTDTFKWGNDSNCLAGRPNLAKFQTAFVENTRFMALSAILKRHVDGN